ncbi:MAG: phage antirepressor N-terminal domain-containing protein [Odoribacter sp.]
MNKESNAASTVAAKINNQELVIISENADKFVPIKPVCDALGIDYPTQFQKLKDDEYLSSVVGLRPTTGSDGKTYQMACLPFELVFGWLFTINPKNVAPEAKDNVIRYRMECYYALYRYFTARAEFVELKQIEIDKQLTVVEGAKCNFKEAKNVLNEADSKLKCLRRLTMEDYDADRRQLKINFEN